jgi:DASH complex subunit DAD4
MENPHEEKQAFLLERIIKNVVCLFSIRVAPNCLAYPLLVGMQEKCNESIVELNQCLGEIIQSSEVSVTSALFQNYSRNVVYNLEATKNLAEPK